MYKEIPPELLHENEFVLKYCKKLARLWMINFSGEDLAQEVYLNVAKYGKWEPAKGSARGYLRKVALNTARSAIKEASHEKELVRRLRRRYNCGEHTSEYDHRELLERAMDLLPGYQRRTLELLVNGFRYREIAAQLEIPIGTVMSRLTRARMLLREKQDRLLGSETIDAYVHAA